MQSFICELFMQAKHLGVLIGDASTLQPEVHLTEEQRDYASEYDSCHFSP